MQERSKIAPVANSGESGVINARETGQVVRNEGDSKEWEEQEAQKASKRKKGKEMKVLRSQGSSPGQP